MLSRYINLFRKSLYLCVKEIEWGYNDIYGISGCLNQHPREAMKLRADQENMVKCYNFFLECTSTNDVDIV